MVFVNVYIHFGYGPRSGSEILELRLYAKNYLLVHCTFENETFHLPVAIH
jgi:hypothetical protein